MTKLPNHVELSVSVTPDWPTFVSELRRMADAIEAQAEAARECAEWRASVGGGVLVPRGVERIAAWEAIAAHPAFRRCYEDGRLLDAMLAELDGIVVEPTPAPTTVELDSLNPGDRFRAIHEYRVDHHGDWQPVAPNRYELVCHDDDPAVAVVRDWLDSGREADAGDLGRPHRRREGRRMNRTLATLALVTVAWALVTIASLGALAKACRYGELGVES